MYPWLDYGGRVSPFKTAVFVALFLPGLYAALAYPLGWLGARPLTEAIHEFGLWTIRFVFLALAIGPARRLLDWPSLIQVRRMVGVAAFCYVVGHFCLYVTDEAFDLREVASEIVLRFYLTIGFVALLSLATLAATSTDGMQRRLGGRRWQRLHRLVYLIALLAIVHFFIQSKADVWEPIWMAGILLWLMGWRVLDWTSRRGRPMRLWQLAGLSLAATIVTGLGEAAYFTLFMHAPFVRVFEANFMLGIGVRPSWIVLGASCVLTLASAVRGWQRLSRGPRAPSPSRNRASAARGA